MHIRKKRKRQHRFFIPFNLTAVENDIAILKVRFLPNDDYIKFTCLYALGAILKARQTTLLSNDDYIKLIFRAPGQHFRQ